MRRIGLAVVVALSLLTPLVAEAEQVAKVARIGYLLLPPLAEKPSAERQAFLQGLRELGYNEGHNVSIEYRSAAWNRELLPDLAAELVARKVDVILAAGPQATLAAREATTTIPIVMIAGVDLVESGLVPSLARSVGNVTGFSGSLAGLGGKRLELLREAVPQVSRVSVIWNPGNPAATFEWKETQAAARTLGMKLESFEVRAAEDFVAALAKMKQRSPAAVVMISDTLTYPYREILAEFAVQNRVPAIMAIQEFPQAGGLMSYGPRISDLFRRAASQVDKILRGTKPANIPVEQPTKFELVINLKTAKALGLTIPQTLLLRADQVIE
jgi:putative tryptophan/tyrosine transport system substrate-binding protein